MFEAQTIDSSVIVNGVELAYQLHGDNTQPTILMIHGLSTPLTGWPTNMVQAIVNQGYQVLLLDNRDMGKSALLVDAKIPSLAWTAIKFKLGLSPKVPYHLEDMMNDTLELLDHLAIEKVHVIGASMGGMIAQLLAIHHPDRVITLTSIMSTTGNKRLPPIAPTISKQLAIKPKSNSYDDRLAYHLNKWRVIGSPNYPAKAQYLQEYVAAQLERGINSKGTIRQILAILAAGNRETLLKKINIPSLVLHGDCDGLVHVDGGVATAESIPNATLKIYPGMGHDLPVELIPQIIQDIVNFIQIDTNKSNVSQ
jgi:pimeloyl-ACP methyl ester carboxylesterase